MKSVPNIKWHNFYVQEDDKLQDNDEIHDASAEEDDDKEDDDDYPVEPPELQAMHPKPKRKPTPGAHIIDEEEEEEEEEHGQDNEEYAVPKSREDKAVQTPERGNEVSLSRILITIHVH